jgi:hypothetical protein
MLRNILQDKLARIYAWSARRYGRAGQIILLILLVLGVIWWNWGEIKSKPWISDFVAWFSERTLPRGVPGRFTVAVAHLSKDNNAEFEDLIVQALSDFDGIQILRFDRTIVLDSSSLDSAIEDGHTRARGLLSASGADVLIWGTVIGAGSKKLPKLYWTTAHASPLRKSGRYVPTEDLNLPELFWNDLRSILVLLIATSHVELKSWPHQSEQPDKWISCSIGA